MLTATCKPPVLLIQGARRLRLPACSIPRPGGNRVRSGRAVDARGAAGQAARRQEAQAVAAASRRPQQPSTRRGPARHRLVRAAAGAGAAASGSVAGPEEGEGQQPAAEESGAQQAGLNGASTGPSDGPTLNTIPAETTDHGRHISFLTAPMSTTAKEQQERERRLDAGRRGQQAQRRAPTSRPPTLDTIPPEVTRGGRHVSMLTAPWSPPAGAGQRRAPDDASSGGTRGSGSGSRGREGTLAGREEAGGGADLATGWSGARSQGDPRSAAWGGRQQGGSSGGGSGSGRGERQAPVGGSAAGAAAGGGRAAAHSRLFPPLAAGGSAAYDEAPSMPQLGGSGGGGGFGGGGRGGGGGGGGGNPRGWGEAGDDRPWWQQAWGRAALALAVAGVLVLGLKFSEEQARE